jgi:hypothetical protein
MARFNSTASLLLLISALCLSVNALADNSSSQGASAASSSKAEGGVSRDLVKEFKALDGDGDGYLSKSEVSSTPALVSGFDAADKNGDGKLDQAEFQALEANTSSDRSLGSASPVEQGSAGGATSR